MNVLYVGERLLSGGPAVHVGDVLLETLADVDAPALQRGGEEAVADAEHVGVQVQVFHLVRGQAEGNQASRRNVGAATRKRILFVALVWKFLTCSNDFSPASLPTAVMSPNTAFFTSYRKTRVLSNYLETASGRDRHSLSIWTTVTRVMSHTGFRHSSS